MSPIQGRQVTRDEVNLLSLKLDQLFTPESLDAFRSSWGRTPQDADRIALRIAKVFEEKSGTKGDSDSQRRRERWLAAVITALVGPEPDFDAWAEALSIGSFDVRPGVTYARSKVSGSPSRFLLRQREKIQKLVNADLPETEKIMLQQMHLDAMRQILVSHIILEMKRAVCAQAAAGLAWPLTVACRDGLSDDAKSYLWHFGGDESFRKSLADALEAAILAWVVDIYADAPPKLAKGLYASNLKPRGQNFHKSLGALDQHSSGVERYREALWKALALDGQPPPDTAFQAPEVLAEADAKHFQQVNALNSPRYRFFTEGNGGEEVFEYSSEEIQRLKTILPALNGPTNEALIKFAADRAMRRAELRHIAPLSQPDSLLQEEIADWVNSENAPPRHLRLEHATYLEEEVCRKYPHDTVVWGGSWARLDFAHPFSVPF